MYPPGPLIFSLSPVPLRRVSAFFLLQSSSQSLLLFYHNETLRPNVYHRCLDEFHKLRMCDCGFTNKSLLGRLFFLPFFFPGQPSSSLLQRTVFLRPWWWTKAWCWMKTPWRSWPRCSCQPATRTASRASSSTASPSRRAWVTWSTPPAQVAKRLLLDLWSLWWRMLSLHPVGLHKQTC